LITKEVSGVAPRIPVSPWKNRGKQKTYINTKMFINRVLSRFEKRGSYASP